MSVRIRNRTLSVVAGTATHTTLSPQPSSSNFVDHCEDVIGNWDGENFLYITHAPNAWWYVSGESQPTGPRWTYNGYVRTASNPAHVGNTSLLPNDNLSLATARARTNPNRSVIDLPVFFVEMKDIPAMIMGISKLIAKHMPKSRLREIQATASIYLGYEFGIKPFLADLYRMMDFTNSVNSRVKELRKLTTPQGIQRNWTVGTSMHESAEDWAYATPLYSESNTVKYRLVTERIKWVSTKWTLAGSLDIPDDESARKLANRLVFGRDIDFSTLYEVMPWSWLIDWFSNVGTIYEGNRNIVPVSQTGSCIMVKTTTSFKYLERRSGPSTNLVVTPAGPFLRQSLQRWPQSSLPIPEFGLPFLNGRQLSILSAIGVSRYRPK